MSRTLSTAAIRANNAQETGEAYAILLTINHVSLSQPIRVTSASLDITSNSNLFTAIPFDLILPDSQDGSIPRAQLSIDNIDRSIVEAVRSLEPGSKASVLIQVVLESTPDQLEVEFIDFYLSNVTYDQYLVRGDLTIENFLSKPYPEGTMSPKYFGGLF